MKIYYFSDTSWEQQLKINRWELGEIFDQIAHGTSTEDLIVVVYFMRKSSWIGGVAFARNWLTHTQFTSPRGRWRFTQKFPNPPNLPANFKLIRIKFGIQNLKYPLCQTDRYSWKLTYASFRDHLAFIFAHELHHFRRYHLGLHPREGENSANRWALEQLRRLNFKVSGVKLHFRKKRKFFCPIVATDFFDLHKKFQYLNFGDRLQIKYDPKGHYQDEIVSVVRPLRKNSSRIVVQTSDGKQWRWPLEWLAVVG